MKLFIYALLTLLWVLPSANASQKNLDFDAFGHIPILHEGRVKPLDSFARAYLQQLHGSQTLPDQTAIEWLAGSVFQPATAVKQPFIKLPNKRITSALGFEGKVDELHSFEAVAAAYHQKRDMVIRLIKKGEDNLNHYELEFIDFYSLINDYSQITRALTLALPTEQIVSAETSKILGLDGTERNYLEFLKAKEKATNTAQNAAERHGQKLERYSKTEQEAAVLAFYFSNVEATGDKNNLFRIIPAFLGAQTEWYAPWALLNEGHGSPKGFEKLKQWSALSEAYLNNDAVQFTDISNQIRTATTDARGTSDAQLTLELLYHQLNPTFWVMLCYGLVVLLCLVPSARRPVWAKWMNAILMTGVGLHALMIVLRIIILERPPVGTLYESVLFVSLVSVLLAWRLDKHAPSHEGKLIGCLLGVFLIAVSGLFAPAGDNLGVLVAVLNTNFWLATHVICITIGYGCALVAGTMAHAYCYNRSAFIGSKLQVTTLIALLFTAIGTILGGIWADQSWGRFWGWDPKENGALAIVIWLVWVLHGRITGHLKDIGFAACLAVTNIIVALSWFGVNLLSVGLHSYGFTDSAAIGLITFCSAELIIICALTLHAKRKERHAS